MNTTFQTNMKTMKWLVKREFWENKGLLFYVPLIVSFITTLLFFILLINNNPIEYFSDAARHQAGITASAEQHKESIKWFIEEMFVRQIYYIFCLGGVLITYYLLGALHTERVDRSILFWKSIPTSDVQTVMSKILFAVVLVPLFLLVVSCISFYIGVFLLCVFSLFQGDNLFGVLLFDLTLYTTPLKILLLLPMYIAWGLPTFAWILMVSSWAKSRVVPWAIGVPLLVTLFLIFINLSFKFKWDMVWFFKNIIVRMIAGGIPGTWLFNEKNYVQSDIIFSTGVPIQQTIELLNSPHLWGGVLTGIAMLCITVRIRSLQNEI